MSSDKGTLIILLLMSYCPFLSACWVRCPFYVPVTWSLNSGPSSLFDACVSGPHN